MAVSRVCLAAVIYGKRIVIAELTVIALTKRERRSVRADKNGAVAARRYGSYGMNVIAGVADTLYCACICSPAVVKILNRLRNIIV